MAEFQYPIFVYGTLMTGERAHHLLASSIDRVCKGALLNASLHSLGSYPIAVPGEKSIRGEVCWLLRPAYQDTLACLDRYEGPQYVRELRNVLLEDASQETSAWVYLGKTLPSRAVLIPSGDWRLHNCGAEG